MATQPLSGVTAANGIDMQSFLRILTQQLTHQDPMKPMDNQAFVAQMAQFAQLQQSQEANESIGQLLYVESATQAMGMLGKKVEFTTATGGSSSGTVSALSFDNGSPLLAINGETVTLDRVTKVTTNTGF